MLYIIGNLTKNKELEGLIKQKCTDEQSIQKIDIANKAEMEKLMEDAKIKNKMMKDMKKKIKKLENEIQLTQKVRTLRDATVNSNVQIPSNNVGEVNIKIGDDIENGKLQDELSKLQKKIHDCNIENSKLLQNLTKREIELDRSSKFFQELIDIKDGKSHKSSCK